MGGDKRNDNDVQARGWNLFRWKYVAEPPETITAAIYGSLFIIFLLIALSGVIGLFQLLAPMWAGSPTSSSSGDPGAELRGRLFVIGALLTTPFLVWRLVVSHWSARAAQEQARIAQETARNTLFTNAIEQLGASRQVKKKVLTPSAGGTSDENEVTAIGPNIEVRLGAIYALEKLARDDLSIHWPIMETLCAYVRENTGPPLIPPKLDAGRVVKIQKCKSNNYIDIRNEFLSPMEQTRVDVQAALTVIGRRSVRQIDCERKLRRSTSSATNPIALDLTKCNLNLANLSCLNLSHAIFNHSSLVQTRFHRSAVKCAEFSNSILDSTYFVESLLSSSRFIGTEINLTNFYFCNFEKSIFNGARLTAINFVGSNLNGVVYDASYANQIYFRNATSMAHSCFRDCTIYTSYFCDSVINDSIFQRTRFELGTDLTKEQLEATWGDAETVVPEGRRPKNDRWLLVGADDSSKQNWVIAVEAVQNKLTSSN